MVQVLSGHEGPVSNLCFSPVQSVLASVSWDKTVRLWDMLDSWQTKETLWLTSDGKFTRCQVETWGRIYETVRKTKSKTVLKINYRTFVRMFVRAILKYFLKNIFVVRIKYHCTRLLMW